MVPVKETPTPTPPLFLDFQRVASWWSNVDLASVAVSLVPAIITALLTAYVTHRMTRDRAWAEWRRQRIFESVVRLNISLERLCDKKHEDTVERSWGNDESKGPFSLLLMSGRINDKPTKDHLEGYLKALMEVELLSGNNRLIHLMCSRSKQTANEYFKILTTPSSTDFDSTYISMDDLLEKQQNSREALKQAHATLIHTLTDAYMNARVKKPRAPHSLDDATNTSQVGTL